MLLHAIMLLLSSLIRQDHGPKDSLIIGHTTFFTKAMVTPTFDLLPSKSIVVFFTQYQHPH